VTVVVGASGAALVVDDMLDDVVTSEVDVVPSKTVVLDVFTAPLPQALDTRAVTTAMASLPRVRMYRTFPMERSTNIAHTGGRGLCEVRAGR
jgi:hypothetical protein